MATIDLKISQSVVDIGNQIDSGANASANGSIGSVVDFLVATQSAINAQYTSYPSFKLSGTTLTVTSADGATQVYTGVSLSNGATGSGTGTATGYTYNNGAFEYEKTGSYTFAYNGAVGVSTLTPGAGTDSSATYIGQLSAADADPTLGNTSFGYTGSVHTDAAGAITGTLTSMIESADKYVSSSVIQGNFQVSGNAGSIAAATSYSSVTGVMTSYHSDYYDGSHEYIDGISANLSASANVDETILANPNLFGGDDVIKLNMPEHLYSTLLMASGAGNDTITLTGGGGLLNVDAGTGNDLIIVASDHHQINGGDGLDTVQYAGASTSYTITQNSSGALAGVADGSGSDTLFNVERLQFSDVSVAFDITGNAGEAYRLYAAAFDRKPDLGGLGYWISALDKGVTLTQAAAGFISSPEFAALYGSNSSDADFVAKLYNNTLHRQPDAGGEAYWINALANGSTRAQVLVGFSESPENAAQVIGAIQHGISYLHQS